MFTENPASGSSITLKNQRAVWEEERKTGLGASDIAAIFGVSPYKSALALYYEKRGQVEMPMAEREALYWGRILEQPIAQRYGDETGRRVEMAEPYTILRHPTMPWMIATLDAKAEAIPGQSKEPPAGGPGVVEIKNAGFFKRDEWMDEPPLPFLIQTNHQMLVAGTQWGSMAALIGGSEFFWADLTRNDAFLEVLVAKAAEFWDRVVSGRPPDADGSASTTQLLKTLYPRDSGQVIALKGKWGDIDDRLVRIKADQKKLSDERDELENTVKHAMGDATAATLDNGAVYTLKTTNRREFTTPATSFRVLRRKGD
jgi:putative phage-type endonuclease